MPIPGARKGSIRLLIVDDHAVLRQGLALVLMSQEDVEIIGEAADGIEALEQARKLNPQIVLMDFSMPRMDGLEATRAIREELPHVRVIGLSMYEEVDRARAMLDAGAFTCIAPNSSRSGVPPLFRSSFRGLPYHFARPAH